MFVYQCGSNLEIGKGHVGALLKSNSKRLKHGSVMQGDQDKETDMYFPFSCKKTTVYSIGYSNTKNTKTQIWRSNKHSNESSVSWLSTPSNKSSILDTQGENSNIIMIDHHGMEQRNYFGAPVFPQSTISYRNNIGPKTTATNSTQSLQALQAVH